MKISYALLGVILAVCVCACSSESNSDPVSVYEATPFTKNTYIPPIDRDVTKTLVGTYELNEFLGSFGYEWLSLYPDGSARLTSQTSYATSEVYSGTWSYIGGKFSINIEGEYRRTNQALDWSLWDTKKMVRCPYEIIGDTVYYDLLRKVSDQTMDMSLYSNNYKIIGLWAYEDDYGDVRGYRFLPEGVVWYYSTVYSDGKGDWGTFQISSQKAELKITVK